MGRPSKGRLRRLSITIDSDNIDFLKELSDNLGLNISELIRMFITSVRITYGKLKDNISSEFINDLNKSLESELIKDVKDENSTNP